MSSTKRAVYIVFLVGMFVTPLLFGSASGAISLLISVYWTVGFFIQKRNMNGLPVFLKTWIFAVTAFFILFWITATVPGDIIYGFNFFAFFLSLGVYAFAKDQLDVKHLLVAGKAARFGLVLGAVLALVQYYYLGYQRTETIAAGGPNLVARIAIFLFAFSYLCELVNQKDKHDWIGVLVSAAATLIVIFLSGSRGVIIALPVLILTITLAPQTRRTCQTRRSFLTGATLISCLILTIGAFLDPNDGVSVAVDRIMSVFAGQGSDGPTEVRMQMWQVAFEAFLKAPIFGTGWHSFREVANNTILDGFLVEITKHGLGFDFHSDIANVAVAGGAVGLLLYFVFLLAPFLTNSSEPNDAFAKQRIWWALTAPALFFSIGLSDLVFGYDIMTMLFAFSFALFWGVTKR